MIRGEVRQYLRAECSDRIRRELARFVLRQKAAGGVKTSEIARRIGGVNPSNLYDDLEDLNAGGLVGWEKLFRLVEALDHEVEVVIKPREKARAA